MSRMTSSVRKLKDGVQPSASIPVSSSWANRRGSVRIATRLSSQTYLQKIQNSPPTSLAKHKIESFSESEGEAVNSPRKKQKVSSDRAQKRGSSSSIRGSKSKTEKDDELIPDNLLYYTHDLQKTSTSTRITTQGNYQVEEV